MATPLLLERQLPPPSTGQHINMRISQLSNMMGNVASLSSTQLLHSSLRIPQRYSRKGRILLRIGRQTV